MQRNSPVPYPPETVAPGTIPGIVLVLLLWAGSVQGQTDDRPPVTVQPGAPGEPSRVLDPDEVEALDRPTFTEADVRFVQGMIRHHEQALRMVDLLRERTNDEGLLELALRIEISQEDEIDLMERWLRDRSRSVPDPLTRDPAGPGPGMLAREEMDRLAAARDGELDRLFLELMIRHHDGALQMVERLLGSSGGGQVSSVYHVAGEVQADQAMEIRRMRRMLDARSENE